MAQLLLLLAPLRLLEPAGVVELLGAHGVLHAGGTLGLQRGSCRGAERLPVGGVLIVTLLGGCLRVRHEAQVRSVVSGRCGSPTSTR